MIHGNRKVVTMTIQLLILEASRQRCEKEFPEDNENSLLSKRTRAPSLIPPEVKHGKSYYEASSNIYVH
eukprot:scaffold410065_cov50-Attheya_sp.AAC.1